MKGTIENQRYVIGFMVLMCLVLFGLTLGSSVLGGSLLKEVEVGDDSTLKTTDGKPVKIAVPTVDDGLSETPEGQQGRRMANTTEAAFGYTHAVDVPRRVVKE